MEDFYLNAARRHLIFDFQVSLIQEGRDVNEERLNVGKLERLKVGEAGGEWQETDNQVTVVSGRGRGGLLWGWRIWSGWENRTMLEC